MGLVYKLVWCFERLAAEWRSSKEALGLPALHLSNMLAQVSIALWILWNYSKMNFFLKFLGWQDSKRNVNSLESKQLLINNGVNVVTG